MDTLITTQNLRSLWLIHPQVDDSLLSYCLNNAALDDLIPITSKTMHNWLLNIPLNLTDEQRAQALALADLAKLVLSKSAWHKYLTRANWMSTPAGLRYADIDEAELMSRQEWSILLKQAIDEAEGCKVRLRKLIEYDIDLLPLTKPNWCRKATVKSNFGMF
ncbi:MAG: hypothetical protein SGJ04_07420 [Bacteroidota bacterium]|nr:hypothetical protein [Bacteroidota bacterium]